VNKENYFSLCNINQCPILSIAISTMRNTNVKILYKSNLRLFFGDGFVYVVNDDVLTSPVAAISERM
jgi:hypothetical protein